MKKRAYKFQMLLAALAACATIVTSQADLSASDRQFLAAYEKVRGALAADELATAKSAAKDLGKEGVELSNAASLKDARDSFEKLTIRAKTLAAGQSGYFVMHCPMLKKDWVQTSDKPSNPYYGKSMANCGELKE